MQPSPLNQQQRRARPHVLSASAKLVSPPARPRLPADRWLPWPLWGLTTLACSVLDQPVRGLSGGRLLASTAAVASSPESYDRARATELWTAAAAVAGLPEAIFPPAAGGE